MVIGNTIDSRWKHNVKDFKLYTNVASMNIFVEKNT